jgi:hypothetical protein
LENSPHDSNDSHCGGANVTAKKPPPGFSAFKKLLEKIAKVPKSEIDSKEAEYIESRKHVVKPGKKVG